MVEHNLAKVGVAGSSPVSRSFLCAQVAELVDALDLKSNGHTMAVRVQVPPWVLKYPLKFPLIGEKQNF